MSDPLNTIQPGKPMSEADKEALRKANADESATAQRLAAEHRARDMEQGGNERPVAQVVASSILDKLKTLPPLKEGEAPTE